MDRFIGRGEDLDFLEELYNMPKFRAVAIIGRRRVGKTCLIEEFVKDKDYLYIQFLESSATANLRHLASCMGRKFGKIFSFVDSVAFFDTLRDETTGRKMVIVFDEYPYISSADDSFSSLLQNFIDHDIGKSLVILSSSSISMMDKEIGDRSRPLFGRVHRYRLEPMKISDCAKFHPAMSEDDQMRMYLTFGGIPMYYDSPETDSYGEYLDRYVLGKNSALYAEGEGMIRREFSHAEEYNAILDAIADGYNTIADLTVTTELDRSTVNHHLGRMESIGLVEEIHMMAGANTRPARYRIKDRMLAFHHYVLRRTGEYDSLSGTTYEEIKDAVSTFHGKMFEMQCADYLREHYKIREIGSWYGKTLVRDGDGNPEKDDTGKYVTENSDIDVVAYVNEGKFMVELFCECKFTKRRVGMEDLQKLRSRMKDANVGSNSRIVLFSRSGFDRELADYSENNDIELVDLRMMLS